MSRKVLGYEIIEDDFSVGLENKVKRYLSMGYELQGGVSVSTPSLGGSVYVQAMVKYSEEE